jgi:small-conductance mechanosensitive channel
VIGSASAKYFEGLLFIIVRRPYNVGDRIHVSDVQHDTPIEGAKGWVVENITLFETTAIWGPTNERCSLSNASLAYSRIINGARSPQAQIWIYVKFRKYLTCNGVYAMHTKVSHSLSPHSY